MTTASNAATLAGAALHAAPASADARPAADSRARLWTGRALSALVVLFLVFDGVTKQLDVAPVREAMAQLGYPHGLSGGIGLLLLACTALYVAPRTALLGAVLLTGYLGGAVAAQVRVGNPLLSHALFPVYVGVLAWAGLLLRDARLRAFLLSRPRA